MMIQPVCSMDAGAEVRDVAFDLRRLIWNASACPARDTIFNLT